MPLTFRVELALLAENLRIAIEKCNNLSIPLINIAMR
jgi:hypothetical protein